MRILFLDVDGVLNHKGIFYLDRQENMLCDIAVNRLRMLINLTGAKVVLSSSWRGMPINEGYLREAGVMALCHEDYRTKRLNHQTDTRRGDEIQEWLDRHPEVKVYAIVDDDNDMRPEQQQFFVQTSFDNGGLIDTHVSRLVSLLRRINTD